MFGFMGTGRGGTEALLARSILGFGSPPWYCLFHFVCLLILLIVMGNFTIVSFVSI
jgi:hypothetical protein